MNTDDLRAEQQALLCVARRNLEADDVTRLRHLLGQSVDWEYLQPLAVDHGLLPLLASHVSSHCADLVPAGVLDRLRAELFTNRESNLYLVTELVRVLSRLRAAGIEALTFKGTVLGQIAYEDIGLRQAGDLDILIRPNDFFRAKEVLREMAYTMDPRLTPAQQKSHFRFHCENTFVHKDGFSVVDLHWRMTPKTFPLVLDADDFLSRRTTICLAGHAIDTLTDEDLVLYLSVNAAKGYFRRLEWTATFAELIKSKPKLSWTTVIARARNAKAEKILCLTLILVESLYGLTVPREFADLSTSADLREAVARIRAYLFTNDSPPTALQAFRWRRQFLLAQDAYMSLMRAVLVPTVADWRSFSIPDALYPIYYLLRPVRLLTKYGGAED
jgi:hypothetical protein